MADQEDRQHLVTSLAEVKFKRTESYENAVTKSPKKSLVTAIRPESLEQDDPPPPDHYFQPNIDGNLPVLAAEELLAHLNLYCIKVGRN